MITDKGLLAELKKPLAAGETYRNIFDAERDGLTVRIGKKGITGKCTFYCVRRKKGDRQPSWIVLGQYPETTLAQAAAMAKRASELLDAGLDPKATFAAEEAAADAAERTRQGNTFKAVVDRFNLDYGTLNSRKTKRPRKTAKRTAAAIDRLLTSKWGARPIADITERDVENLIKAIRDRGQPGVRRQNAGGHNVARNAFDVARLVFKWARKQKVIAIDPTANLEAGDLYNGVTVRDRVLSDDELRRIWDAAARMGGPYGSTVQMLMLTGARREEIAQARWSEIQGDDALVVPSERMKMNGAFLIPLAAKAREILDGLPRFNGGDFIFTTTAGAKPSLAGSKRKAEIDALLPGMSHWVLHDIRRTVRTRLTALGIPEEVAERVIAHGPGGIVKVYNLHNYAAEKRQALEAWEAALMSIVAPQPEPDDKVVPIRRSA